MEYFLGKLKTAWVEYWNVAFWKRIEESRKEAEEQSGTETVKNQKTVFPWAVKDSNEP